MLLVQGQCQKEEGLTFLSHKTPVTLFSCPIPSYPQFPFAPQSSHVPLPSLGLHWTSSVREPVAVISALNGLGRRPDGLQGDQLH